MAAKVTQLRPAIAPADPVDALVAALIRRGKDFDEVVHVRIGEVERATLAEHVIREFEDTRSANAQFYRNQIEMTKNWRGTTESKDFPFEGSANLRMPLTSSFVEQTKARMLKALFGPDPGQFCKLSPVDALIKDSDLAAANTWLDWEMREIIDLRGNMKDAIHNVLLNGIGLIVPNYEHRTRLLRSVRKFELADTPLPQQLQQALQQIINTPTSWSANRDEGLEVISQTDQGVFKLSDGGKITFSITKRGDAQATLCAEIFRKETIYDAVKCHVINLEDIVTPNSAASIDDIPFLGIRYFELVSDFRQYLDDGFYECSEEDAERVAQAADIKIGDYFQQSQSVEQDREEGTDSRELTGFRPSRLWIEVYRWEGWWVWSPDGSPYTRDKALEPATQIAVWVNPRTRKILKVARLEDLNKDGKRSAVKFDYIREPGRFISMGFAEWLRHMQGELDAVHNQRIDAGLLTNAPFGFYVPGAGMTKEVLKIQPGTLKPVKDAQSVFFPPLNWQPRVSQQDEELILNYAMMQGGLTDQSLGVPISKRQSASEFAGVSANLDLRTEMILEDFIKAFRELIFRVYGLYQQFGPRKRMFRIEADDGHRLTQHFELDRMQGRMEVTLASNLAQVNDQLQRQTALDMLQLLLNQILISLGIVGPDTIWAAVDKLAKAMHYTGVPIHKPQIPTQSDAPNIEHARMAAGLPVGGPNQGENFQEHMQAHSMLASDPHLAEKLSPEAQRVLGDHIAQTAQMQQQVAIMKSMMAAQATSMAIGMKSKGIRPGEQGGGQPGDNKGPGTAAEGVAGGGAAGVPGAAA